MTAGATACADAALVGVSEVATDQLAVCVARDRGLDEADASANQQRLDRRHRGVERAGQLLIAHAVDFAHQQRRALLIG